MPNSHLIGVRARGPAANGISIVTPVSPQPPGTTLLVNGGYTGAMTSGTLVWRQGGNDVGTPVAIRTIAAGAWSTTITTPAAPGSYTLRAAFNGTAPAANSGGVTIEVGAPATVAEFGFVGTGDGDGSIALFAHPFAQGDVQPTDPVLLRRSDTNAPIRTQFEPITTWPDGSVRIALMAAELPALADNVALNAVVRRGEAHASPGPNLTWAAALAGRSIFLRTWAPGNTTTPLWSYDVGAALASSTDNWQVGPLAISRRVRSEVPASGVLNTSDVAGVITSVRVVCDVTATKDGMLLVDAWFCNDRMLHPGGGHARFGYTIEIDGQIVYDQRPATGAARDLLQYNWWGIRHAKRGTTVYNFYDVFRPTFRPDPALIARAHLRLPVDLAARSAVEGGVSQAAITGGAGRLNDPYWPWGLTRDAGGTGGRVEIGLSTRSMHAWMTVPTESRLAELVAHKQAEAFTRSGCLWRDWDLDEPLLPDTWPRWINHSNPSGHTPATPGVTTRTTAQYFPTSQPAYVNSTANHLTHDNAHRGAFWAPLAALSGRRIMFDLAAHRMAEASTSANRWNGTSLTGGGPNWRTLTPNWETGVAWTTHPWSMQVRGYAWSFRDVSDADYVLPDTYPRREAYRRTCQAWINVAANAAPVAHGVHGGSWIGLPIMGGEGRHVTWQGVFAIYSFTLALLRGQMSGAQLAVFNEYTRFRSGAVLAHPQLARRMCGGDNLYTFFHYAATTTGPGFVDPCQSWQDVVNNVPPPIFRNGFMSYPTGIHPPANNQLWNTGSGSDYYIQSYQGLAFLATHAPDMEMRARAREAMVYIRSYREQASENNFPRMNPGRVAASGEPQVTHFFPSQWTYLLNTAPVITAGQSFSIPTDAATGTLVGLVEWTGPLPRRGDAEGGGAPAWEIVSQPAGNPFTISDGGVLRRSGTGSFAFGPNTVTVRARCFDADETERVSAPVALTVNGTAIAPALSGNQSPQVAENAAIGSVVAAFTYTGTVGTPTIQSGNDNSLFEVVQVTPTVPGGPNAIEVRVAASLAGFASQARNLVLRVTNGAGFSEAQCTISIIAPVNQPTIAPGQTFQIETIAAVGSSPTPNAVTVGGAPSTKSILVPSGPFAIHPDTAVLTTTGSLGGVDATVFQYTPTIRAQNAGGTADRQITINVVQPASVWSTAAPNTVILEAWSVARRLRNSYAGPLIRVRRASDNAEQDIGIASGVLDETALTTFVGTSQGFIVRVYGQFGNRDLVQTSASAQYEITAAGGAIRRFGGTQVRPTAFTGSSSRMMLASPTYIGGSRATHALGIVAHTQSLSATLALISAGAPTGSLDAVRCMVDATGFIQARRLLAANSDAQSAAGAITTSSRIAAAAFYNAGAGTNSVQLRWNGTSVSLTNGPNVAIRLGERDTPTMRYDYFVSIGAQSAAPDGLSRPLTWAEAYFTTNASAAELDAVIADQRAFFGF